MARDQLPHSGAGQDRYVVIRDRTGACAEGARQGALDAVPVAERLLGIYTSPAARKVR